MTTLVAARVHRLAQVLAGLKVKVRAALATELAGAVSSAVRDVLTAALLDGPAVPRQASTPAPNRGGRWDDPGVPERAGWGDPRDPWADPDDSDHPGVRDRVPARGGHAAADAPDGTNPSPNAPAAALAIGVRIGRWWLARGGAGVVAVGIGVVAAALGLAGGPVARAALAALSAATDLLAAEATLARPGRF